MADEMQLRRAVRGWSALLIALCLAVFWLQCRHIARTLPYPLDVDEGFVSGPASRTLVTGTFHPYRFTYPSLPKYLASIGMGFGFLRAASHLEIRDIQALGNVGYPYYDTPRAVQGAKQLFALLSVGALAATGVLAWHATRRPPAILLAPLTVALSPLFFYHSWTYLNVDIVAFTFSTLTLAACLIATRRPSIVQAGVVPGIYAGLATGSKYTLALTIVPVLVTCVLYLPPGRRLRGVLAAVATMILAFVIVMPYSLIDLPAFLSGVASEAYHYASGHAGFQDDPGWPQLLFYARHFIASFGPVAAVMAMVGAIWLLQADWRRAAIVLSLPAALGALLLGQRVHFERNVLSLHPVYGFLVVCGTLAVHNRLGRRFPALVQGSTLRKAATWAVLLGLSVPWWHAADEVRDHIDSRNAASAWIERRAPRNAALLVPKQLSFDSRALKSRGLRVTEIDLAAAQSADAFQRVVNESGAALLLLPVWGADSRLDGGQPAETLNGLARTLTPMVTFGSNPVLVNYSEPVPWGNPKFGLVALGGLVLRP